MDLPLPRAIVTAIAAGLAAVLLAGCATGTAQMTPQQREAFELRRFCETQGSLDTRCIGFQGWW